MTTCICDECRGHISNAELRPVTGAEVRAMMRTHRLTIRAVAKRFGFTMKLVRERRNEGAPWDWPLIVGIMARENAPPRCTRGVLWDVFESAEYGTMIERVDSPDEEGVEPLEDDTAALELCISEAKAGHARAIEALEDIARVYHDELCEVAP